MKDYNRIETNYGLYKPYSPIKSPMRNLSPIRKQSSKNILHSKKASGELSPLRRRPKDQPKSTQSTTPNKGRPKFVPTHNQPKEVSYEYMESTIKKKCGLFKDALKRKQSSQNNKITVKTQNTEQGGNQISFSEVSEHKKSETSKVEKMKNKKTFQTLISNVKEIESVHCSNAFKENNHANHQPKHSPVQLNSVFADCFGSAKSSEIIPGKSELQQQPIEKIAKDSESFEELNTMIKKLGEKPTTIKQISIEESVMVSSDIEKQYHFSMSPFLN